ncbi:glycoside hydrolase family 18 protein [Lentithecium fluviatile CBS 122367]|uniref:chitinase n=1 Tax=Lentithecium fluviatile CBS 122367 TaxID=1168545 RepID=A0A6G1J7D0_9PLEO|nr:glycoside hydrolase family 18 protein [Lentithecium fluviatile CBS 122367]
MKLNHWPCPAACNSSSDWSTWFEYHNVKDLAVCEEPLLLTFNLYAPIDDPNTHTTIRACTVGDDESTINFLEESGYVSPDAKGSTNFGTLNRRRDDSADTNTTCGIGSARESRATDEAALDVVVAAQTLKKSLQETAVTCDKRKNLFACYHGTLVGVYSGSRVDLVQTSESMLDELIAELKNSSSSLSWKALEACGGYCTTTHIFGIVADPRGDFSAVQDIVKSWNEGELFGLSAAVGKSLSPSLWTYGSGNGTSGNGTALESRSWKGRLDARAECRSIRVEDRDTCTTLASRCGIGTAAFRNFNKNRNNFNCNKLQPGQPVCCSSGTLPDISPDPSPDGTCATHEVKENQGCQVIAVTYGITEDDLFDFNKKTWGWDGCKDGNPKIGLRLCVSKGNPPMPASVFNAECGPTVPGTEPPGDDEDLTNLNPCPFDDFCIPSNSSTGNPGTSAPGENGCIANCSMELVNNGTPPKEYRKISYFVGWNYNRKCLNMHVDDIEDGYTHIHFAFGEFISSLEVLIKDHNKEQWKAFLDADRDYKKILSFGGWEFSNGPSTSGLFRKAVAPGNRNAVADRLVKFANDNGIDGLDFDWEYPAPPTSRAPSRFLKLVRQKLPSGKLLSIATASSYWYLKGFPMKKMAPYLDYIVFMTYDLHGQWDVNRKWSMEGCEAGNCLRSHINSTLTMGSMIMMTKAGVPSHKVVMGVTSYGRSFKMTDPTCRGPMCTSEGGRNESPAKKGKCTDTGGYISNVEINEIIKQGGAIKKWYDKDTDSDYLVYDRVEWVAYMTDETKKRRAGE